MKELRRRSKHTFVLNCEGKSIEGPLLVENVCMGTTGCSAASMSVSTSGVFIMRVKTLPSDFAESLEGLWVGVCMAGEGAIVLEPECKDAWYKKKTKSDPVLHRASSRVLSLRHLGQRSLVIMSIIRIHTYQLPSTFHTYSPLSAVASISLDGLKGCCHHWRVLRLAIRYTCTKTPNPILIYPRNRTGYRDCSVNRWLEDRPHCSASRRAAGDVEALPQRDPRPRRRDHRRALCQRGHRHSCGTLR